MSVEKNITSDIKKIKTFTVALAGNPNTGKTSIFNALTHQHQHVGNWPGVTVEKKEGTVYNDNNEEVKIVDLPGIYSLRTRSQDEIVASSFLLENTPDMTVVILDASKFERSFYLLSEIRELGQKTIVVLNMTDVANENGIEINADKLSELLNCPVIKTVASNNNDIEKLKKLIISTLSEEQDIIFTNFSESVEESLKIIENNIPKNDFKISNLSIAIKIAEKDDYFSKKFLKNEKLNEILKNISKEYKENNESDLQTKIIEDRWNYISNICKQVIIEKGNKSTSTIISDRIDKIVINKILGLPIFFLIIFLMFVFVYNLGNPIIDFFEKFISIFSTFTKETMVGHNIPDIIQSLIINGLINGVGTVITFFPQIFLLFLFLGMLEDTGYLSRGAFVMDRLMHYIGLNGKSFIPLIMGFGCNVPAIVGTRILEKRRDRMLTMLVVPFISCSARLPVFVLFCDIFFKKNAPLMIFSLYIIGITVSVIIAKILSRTLFKSENSSFVMELPTYHIPNMKNIINTSWERSSEFLKRAATFIMLTVIIVWTLGNLPIGVQYASENSIIGIIGKKITFLFSFAGYGFWKASVALLTGVFAKEAIIGTLATLLVGNSMTLTQALQSTFTQTSAYSYLIMVLLYTPCLPTIMTFKSESNSVKWTIFFVIYTFAVGLLISTLIYQLINLI